MPIACRIKLYQTYGVESCYVIPLYSKFCLREDGPTDEETEVMGVKAALAIYRARERLRTPPNSGNAISIAESDAVEAITSILGYHVPQHGLGSVFLFDISSLAHLISLLLAQHERCIEDGGKEMKLRRGF